MQTLSTIEPVDYLIIGHITQDITADGLVLGGTASYAALTARAFGMKVGIVTSCAPDLFLPELEGIQVVRKPSIFTSTFKNNYTPAGRIQYIHHVAEKLVFDDVPPAWRNTPIVHLGPLANEIGPEMVKCFPTSQVDITPQGWLRGWDGDHIVTYRDWPEADQVLPYAQATVMSIEDVRGNEDVVAEFAALVSILVVTEGAEGCRVYWNSDVRHFRPPQENEVDPVGAGDVFASSFFIKFKQTQDPWESARFATLVAANSVTRKGILGVPTFSEIQALQTEIVEHPVK